MRVILLRNRLLVCKLLKNYFKSLNLSGIVSESLVVFLTTVTTLSVFHNPIDFSIASMEDRSRAGSSRNAPLSTSFIAARVVAFGS